MDTFGFTKKKLLSLCPETQNKHIIIWLSGFYQKLTSNRVNPAALDLFARQYNDILNWTGMRPFIKPDSTTARVWIETISDRIHFHRSATGSTCRDHDLFEKIQTNDLPLSCHQTDFQCHEKNIRVSKKLPWARISGLNRKRQPILPKPCLQKRKKGSRSWVLRPLKVPVLFTTLHGTRKPLLYLEMKNTGSHHMSWKHVTGLLIFQCSVEKIPLMLPMPSLLSAFMLQDHCVSSKL